MKSITEKLTYPGTTIDQVAAMLADPTFREQVADYQQAERSSAEISGTGAGSTARVEIVHGTEHVPSFARKFVGDEIAIVQEETWTSDTHADVLVTIPGKPGDMTGTFDLAQVRDDVVETVQLAVKVNIPFVGGKVEDLIAGLLSKAFRAENKVGQRWLAGS
ncbi:DUF2505 domain-containing protein [Nocardioides currus]|nr:DUF2505 domain-containing protein [Nocardioides currus]